MTAPQKIGDRQPLEKVEIFHHHPFLDISLDILGGDLPRTKRGNKYLLVLVCNISKYVHAIPLRNLKAQTIADKLTDFFLTFGFPLTWRSDNMSSFKGELITAMRQVLNIDAKFSQPFHYQSHGAVERVNLTIETMLRKFISEQGKKWDELIPYFLSALKEVPHSGSKFSANQLIFGHNIRGLMSIAREIWTQGDPAKPKLKMSTVAYVQKLKGDIETALKAARENTEHTYHKIKIQFDKKATHRELNVGDKAIVLQPTSGNKLMAHWRGPYEVLRKCSSNNYELLIGKRRAILHINSLRRYNERESSSSSMTVNVIIDEDEADTDIN